jgi:single-strand selective monofunctional uracil DNA glycosylase
MNQEAGPQTAATGGSPDTGRAASLITAAIRLRHEVDRLSFADPVRHVYNPLDYAWAPHQAYLNRFGNSRKRMLLLGMNPGPYGMMQTGVPFGEVAAVTDWMQLREPVAAPADQHPKRPILGFDCPRSEVSGRRLWGWARLRFGTAEAFFAQAFVVNYCPLVFLEAGGRNRTPEQLPAVELRALQQACDRHLAACITTLEPDWLIGVGGFAEKRLRAIVEGDGLDSPLARRLHIGQILHPSPASPAANRGWSDAVDRRLADYGLIEPVGPAGTVGPKAG